jgi:hypothetical protein
MLSFGPTVCTGVDIRSRACGWPCTAAPRAARPPLSAEVAIEGDDVVRLLAMSMSIPILEPGTCEPQIQAVGVGTPLPGY